ncbi:MAG: NUMOD3 domain-containing DNA-binding protein [Halorientalis sp.]
MVTRYRSGWWLEIKYHDEGWTQQEIADECGVSPRTIRTYMTEFDIETRDVEGENHGLYGESRDEETKEKISETLEGRTFDEETIEKRAETRRGQRLSAETRRKISEALSGHTHSEETRRKMSESTSGAQNPNWRGGYSNRYGHGWSIAREKVHDRDQVCQHCGHDGSTRQLQVHHIVPVRLFRNASDRELSDAHQLHNLVLLCNKCHPKADHGVITFESRFDPSQD